MNDRINDDFYKLPNKKFENIDCLIGSKRIDEGIPNDINGYMILKDKSTLNDKFLINYKDFIDNYRIYSFNIDRLLKMIIQINKLIFLVNQLQIMKQQYMLFTKRMQQ